MSASILTQISTLTAYLTGIATCTVADDLKTASVMEDKTILYCGECDNFLYEDTEQSEWRRIGDKYYCPDCYELDEETDEYVPKKGDNNE